MLEETNKKLISEINFLKKASVNAYKDDLKDKNSKETPEKASIAQQEVSASKLFPPITPSMLKPGEDLNSNRQFPPPCPNLRMLETFHNSSQRYYDSVPAVTQAEQTNYGKTDRSLGPGGGKKY